MHSLQKFMAEERIGQPAWDVYKSYYGVMFKSCFLQFQSYYLIVCILRGDR